MTAIQVAFEMGGATGKLIMMSWHGNDFANE